MFVANKTSKWLAIYIYIFHHLYDEVPDIVVATSVWCMPLHACVHACVVHMCVCPSRFVRAISCTFVHGFQNYLAQSETVPFESFDQACGWLRSYLKIK